MDTFALLELEETLRTYLFSWFTESSVKEKIPEQLKKLPLNMSGI